MTTWALFVIRLLLALMLCANAAYTLLAVWAARKWRQERASIDPDWTPGVTILKPVRGIDAEAYANFVSFCRLDYPADRVQLIFGALDEDDPALALARLLQAEFPDHSIDVICGGPEARRGHNLKVCNLLSLLPHARHDLLVLCDSDMRVPPDYLRRVAGPFKNSGQWSAGGEPQVQSTSQPGPPIAYHRPPTTGLVTCPYRGVEAHSLPALLEGLGIGASFIPSALVSRAIEGVGFAFGSTIALPKAALQEIGGFESLLDELADDFRLGQGMRRAGYEVVVSDCVVDDVLGAERFGPMWARRLRWARTVRSCRPAGYAGSVVTHGTPWALLFLLSMGGAAAGWTVLLAVLLLRGVSAAWIAVRSTGDGLVARWFALLPLSDLLDFALFLASYAGRAIVWRGERFRLLPGGKLTKETRPQKV